jgi:predicted CoA-substrate-specific enzyme activase
MSPEKQVLAGFYTRTAGRPVAALCSLLEAMDELASEKSLDLIIVGAGTTGSGRKFVGRIAGADLIIDEITAHARAALELKPDVDTIIEIGGQDSKFTTLKDGRVTFSIMNTVCAAGTGSFLEEQAEKLGVDLADYAELTRGVAAPVTSDRCTVFMERDINYYLSLGYGVNQVLAAALHSVRENYLSKVAVEAAMGKVVCFQGATARNRSLVAAFEQRLGRPVYVSKFCHLTGALGVALHLADDDVCQSSFRGLDLYKTEIPVRSEICKLCPNHCKLTIAQMADGPVAFGFLCGRDYDTRHFVDNNKSGFDLIKARGRVFCPSKPAVENSSVTVGIPSTLYLHEDVSMWVDFFRQLGMKTITLSRQDDALGRGKAVTGAEFCAPMTALHGHVELLLKKADFVFLPYYLENKKKDKEGRRQYCYYSQFAPVLAASADKSGYSRIISPVVKSLYNPFHMRLELYRAVRRINPKQGFFEITNAWDRAMARRREAVKKWHEIYKNEFAASGQPSVMFLGRPYTLLDPAMNKNIPQIFGALGVKGFFQDMLDLENIDDSEIEPFLAELHWNYAADIIKAAKVVSQTQGLYPVLVTSFKCSPDSFIRDVFQSLMEGADKPYLILELDEHGSSVGYETRIEAAVRSFDNHLRADNVSKNSDPARINPVKTQTLQDKTIVLPSWDPITCRFLAANLRREGIDARVVTETPEAIRNSMHLNSGQCIPINVMAMEFVDYVRKNNLDPSNTVLWMGYSEVPCNIRLYPYKIKEMISSFGKDMAKAGVYTGEISFVDISLRAASNAYFAFMFGGLLRRMACRTRPYEKIPGETDRAVETGIEILEQAFLGNRDKESAVIETVRGFEVIDTVAGQRPKVAIFGDLYARDNPVFNQDLISLIEDCGAEALTTPYTDYAKMIAPAYFKKWFTEGRFMSLLVNRGLLAAMVHREKTYFRHFKKILKEPEPVYDMAPEKILAQFNMIRENTGESMDNILKIYYICRHHPDVALFVQTSPAFCCPSLITEAMAKTIEDKTGVPVVSITYDGTGGDKNSKIVPYLKYGRADAKQIHQKMTPEPGVKAN